MKLLRRTLSTHPLTVELCDACSTVATEADRTSALRERSLQAALRFGPRM